ncbi:unnamed protein product [Heterobilharzia americana]|nr:unnamed protein product [Heterobilharzia americana]
MNQERLTNSKKINPCLSGLTLNLSEVSLPVGPTLVPQFSSPNKVEELSSFVGENASQPRGSISEPGRRFSGTDSASADNAHMVGIHSPPLSSSKPVGSTMLKSSQRPRYVLPPDINTFTSKTSTTNIPQIPYNPLPLKPPTFESNQISTPLIISNPSNDVKPAYLPVSTGASQSSQSKCQNINSASATPSSMSLVTYHPVGAYWFYSTVVENISVWWPFSRHDSYQIETEFLRSYYRRERRSVYWEEKPGEVRRATWFYKPQSESRVLPFSERICDLLEAQYKVTVEQSQWGRRFELPSEDRRGGNDIFIFCSPQSMIQYLAWPYDISSVNSKNRVVPGTSSPSFQLDPSEEVNLTGQIFEGRVCYIRRGLTKQLIDQIDEGDYKPIDQLFFIVHGIGSIYNLKGQGLIECVNDMRRTARQLSQTHFSHHPYRVEFLPILWHDELHSDTVTGLDKQLEQITLGSIPKLRQFTNDTLMDILFYTSSKYSQIIVNTVAREITRLRNLFLLRNPKFTGNISIIGHSLGAVISFDLLCHQNPYNPSCAATVDQLSAVSSETTYNNTTAGSIINNTDTQSMTTGDVDYVDELLSDLLTNQSTGCITPSTMIPISATSTAAAAAACTMDAGDVSNSGSTTIVTSVNYSTNVSSLSCSSSASSTTYPLKGNTLLLNTNEENKSEHSSESGQNDIDGWSIVDYKQQQHTDNNHNGIHYNKQKTNVDNNNNTVKCQLSSMFNASSLNTTVLISNLSQILLQNGMNVEQTRSVLHSLLIKLNDHNQDKDASPMTSDPTATTTSSSLLPTTDTVSHTTFTSFWLENHRFSLNHITNNGNGNATAGFGSPIPLFLTARGIRTLSREFHLPTCSTFYNIFHPFDPVAYRMEMLIDPEFQQKAILIPHHKGRKRIHLQLKDNLAWVGSELKSKLYSSVQSTWRSLHEFALAHKFIGTSGESLPTGSSVATGGGVGGPIPTTAVFTAHSGGDDDESEHFIDVHNLTDDRDESTTTYHNLIDQDITFNSQLNQGRRMDYVLQEAPLESFNEYLFALTSHAAYWDSIDTVLFILTEAYSDQGIVPLMPGQKNISQSTIRVAPLSPPPPPPPPSLPTGPSLKHIPTSTVSQSILLTNMNSTVKMSPSSQFDQVLIPLNNSNQKEQENIVTTLTPPVITTVRKPSVYISPSLATTVHDSTTISFNQSLSSQDYSSTSIPSTEMSTQKYFSPQTYEYQSPESLKTSDTLLQAHHQYSGTTPYVHRKPTSTAHLTTVITPGFLSPSIVTTTGVAYHPVVSSVQFSSSTISPVLNTSDTQNTPILSSGSVYPTPTVMPTLGPSSLKNVSSQMPLPQLPPPSGPSHQSSFGYPYYGQPF